MEARPRDGDVPSADDHDIDPGETQAQEISGPKPNRKRWSRTGVILTTVITVVGTIASVIGVIQVLTRDTTKFSHLQISAEPTSDQVREWAVPEAVLESLPASRGCDSELNSWLEVNAEPLQRSLSIRLRNHATEGAMLALIDFRANGAAAEQRGPLAIRLVCDPAGSLPHQIYFGRIDADKPGAPANRMLLKSRAQAEAAVPVPVAFNLAPGESGTLPVELFSRMPATGSLEVTVLNGKEQQDLVIPGSEFELPAMLFGGSMYLLTTESGLVCLQTERRIIDECAFDELKHAVATAQK